MTMPGLYYRPSGYSICKDLGHVNTFKLAPNSSLENFLIPQLADIFFNVHKFIFGQANIIDMN